MGRLGLSALVVVVMAAAVIVEARINDFELPFLPAGKFRTLVTAVKPGTCSQLAQAFLDPLASSLQRFL